jgi:predicted regulator of Ras-like GTPase activity (Roadblock/LC7/MglB family)
MQASTGVLLVAIGSRDLLVAVVADPGVNVGLTRLEMMRAAEAALA